MRTLNSSSRNNLDGNRDEADEMDLGSSSDETHHESKPELDADEGADILETPTDALEAQRENEPERRDEEIISLDPSD